jgi:hypothetical protein
LDDQSWEKKQRAVVRYFQAWALKTRRRRNCGKKTWPVVKHPRCGGIHGIGHRKQGNFQTKFGLALLTAFSFQNS